MKCQDLFSLKKKKKNFFECYLLQILLGALRVNSANPVESAFDEPYHHDLLSLPFFSSFTTDTPISYIGFVQIQRWRSPLQKVRVERLNLHLPHVSCRHLHVLPPHSQYSEQL